jgi:hypothetical protein
VTVVATIGLAFSEGSLFGLTFSGSTPLGIIVLG